MSLNIANGTSSQKTDVLDMNGDRVVDVVSRAGEGTSVRVTDVRDPSRPAAERPAEGFGLRKSEDGSASFGLGVSDPWRRMSDDGVVEALISMYPSVGGGIGVNFSSTERELADVNGDGLPDEVSREVPGCFSVRLNLGTHFAAHADCVPVANWSDREPRRSHRRALGRPPGKRRDGGQGAQDHRRSASTPTQASRSTRTTARR